MKKKRWTQKEVDFIRDNCDKLNSTELGSIFGVSKKSIKNIMTFHNIFRKQESIDKFIEFGIKKSSEICKNRIGENNPRWKGGRSKNNYYYKKIQVERYPDRVRARALVSRAIKSGKLVRLPCEICGCINTQAHHDDYSKPLDVRWFCREHHRNVIHGGNH